MAFPHTFATYYPSISLSDLDANFSQLSSTSTSTVSLAGAALIGFLQSGSGLSATTVAEQLQKADFFESIAALKAWSGPTNKTVAFVRGYYAAGDGGGGLYYYDSSSTETDNGGVIITPTAAPASGRWLRQYDALQYSVRVWGAKGDGTTDDAAAIQAVEDYVSGTVGGGTVVWPVGTYMLGSTISKKEGTVWKGDGIIDPDATNSCAMVKLLANADCKLLETPTGNSGSINDAIQYVGIENMVFDGNVDNQTRSTEYTLIDFRGVYFPGYLKRLLIRSCYGPALDTGTAGDVRLEDIWILNPVTDSYGWRHNNGYAINNGELGVDEVAVEYVHKATGYTAGDNAATLKSDPTKRGKGIYLGNPEKFIAGARGLHVEGVQPGITVSGGVYVDLGRMDANYLGDDTNADLIKLSSAPQAINVDYARASNVSSGTTNLIEASGAGSYFPDVAYTSGLPALIGYRQANPSYTKDMRGRMPQQPGGVASANNLSLGAFGHTFTITGTTQINLIDSTYFNNGDVVVLKFNGALTVKHNIAHSGTYDTVFLKAGSDLSTAAGTTLHLYLDTSDNRWYEI